MPQWAPQNQRTTFFPAAEAGSKSPPPNLGSASLRISGRVSTEDGGPVVCAVLVEVVVAVVVETAAAVVVETVAAVDAGALAAVAPALGADELSCSVPASSRSMLSGVEARSALAGCEDPLLVPTEPVVVVASAALSTAAEPEPAQEVATRPATTIAAINGRECIGTA